MTGQNAIAQAKTFNQALNLTGLIVTKLDGTAKAGAIFSIVGELLLPVHYIGYGEALADIDRFDPVAFVDKLLPKIS